MLEGWQWREDRAWERAAWMVAYLLQPWSKRPITPAELLQRPQDADAPPAPETFKDWLAQAQAKQDARKGASRGGD